MLFLLIKIIIERLDHYQTKWKQVPDFCYYLLVSDF